MLIPGLIQIPRLRQFVQFYRRHHQPIPDCLLDGGGGALLVMALLFTNWALYVDYTLVTDDNGRHYKLGFFTTN